MSRRSETVRYAVVTSQERGLASLFVEMLGGSGSAKIPAPIVFLCHGSRPQGATPPRFARRLRKIRRIGALGALNGVRMRRWYGSQISDALGIGDIRQVCKNAGMELVEIPSFWDQDSQKSFSSIDADFAISLGNGLIPEEFFSLPRYGMINIHHELLPEYRGAQTALWQIHNGSRVTGFSIHRINRRIDAGAVLLREEMPILFHRTLRETIVQTACAVQRRSLERLFDIIRNFEEYPPVTPSTPANALYTTPSATAMLRIYRNHSKLRRSRP